MREYKDANLFDLIAILLMVIVAGVTYLLFGGTKKDRRIAEWNEKTIAEPMYRDSIDKTLSKEEKDYLMKKWRIVNSGFKEALYDYGGTWENAKLCDKFMEQYNINLYSEDFDPEYVAKCVRDWKI